MPTTGEVLRIGPFVGGLNLSSDESAVADEELVVCKNLELDIDGSLKHRPPFSQVSSSAPEGHKIIGTAVFNSIGYLFSSGTTSGNVHSIQWSTDGITWTQIITNRLAETCIQYRGKVWFPPSPLSPGAGIQWDPVGGSSDVAAMPQGSSCVVHKERLYLVPGVKESTDTSRLYFSDPAVLTTWPGTNFIDVSPGDGESLNAIIVYNDNLLLFKNRSVFVLAYDIDPSDAILREINPVIGVTDGDSVIQFENVVYILHEDIVYEIVNYDFNPINIKVPFVFDATTPPALTRTVDYCISIVGDRLLIKYYSKMYVYGLRTKTWGEWLVTHDSVQLWHDITRFWKLPNTTNYFARRAYIASQHVMKMPENPTPGDTELTGTQLITCTARTKDFDMADPVHFKRLFWWSADILSGQEIIGRVTPVTYTFAPVWNDMNVAWQDIVGTWGQPFTEPLATVTTYPADNNYSLSKTAKFLKSMRFRKIQFEVELKTDGRSIAAAKLFSLTATVGTKQKIVQGVS